MKNFFATRIAQTSCFLGAIAASMMFAQTVHAFQLLDDFSGAPSGTSTVILDVNGGGSNTSTWQNNGGQLELVTTGYDDIEQLSYIFNGASLMVGDELQADFTDPIAGNRNFGLYVGGTAPATGVRQDFISVYGGSNANNQVFTRGFDGTTEFNNLASANVATNYDQLFIARTAANTFDVGFITAGVKTVIATRTPAFANSADFIGFYADVRADGTISGADNLTIVQSVPEPGSLALLAIGSIGLVVRRRKR